MKILLINWQDRLNPQAGGAEVHLHEIFGRLVSGGDDVTMLASGWPGAAEVEMVDGLEVHRTGSRYTFGALAPAYYRRHLRPLKHDVVIEALNKVPIYSPLWSSAPVVLLVHHLFGTTAFQEASIPLAAMTWVLERPIGRVYLGVPGQAISESTRSDLVDRGLRAADVEVVYPGVDLDFFAPDPAVSRPTVPTFVYLGRLKRYKGIDLILRALAKMKVDGLEVRLWIGGRGEWEPALRSLADELGVSMQVDFLGYVTEQRKRELFQTAWANVFPSPKEGWGITNIEAAACGTPTIASDSPGLRESVRDGETGLLVRHGDVAALAAAMSRLARSPEEVRRMGSAAYEFSRTFSWTRAATETRAHLSAIAGPTTS